MIGVLLFADDESADLFGTHAIDIPIKAKAISKSDFMTIMMP